MVLEYSMYNSHGFPAFICDLEPHVFACVFGFIACVQLCVQLYTTRVLQLLVIPYRAFRLLIPLTYIPMLISGPDITLRKTPVFHSKLQ